VPKAEHLRWAQVTGETNAVVVTFKSLMSAAERMSYLGVPKPAWEKIKESLRKEEPIVVSYTQSPGHPALLHKVARGEYTLLNSDKSSYSSQRSGANNPTILENNSPQWNLEWQLSIRK